jgi:IS605 OrfB family transposase
MVITYNFRIKDSTTRKRLTELASYVNLTWNYCNEVAYNAWKSSRKYLSDFDLNYLMKGSSKEIPLHSQTFQSISKEFITRKKQFKKVKLKWRSYKVSLGWIPFKSGGIKLQGSEIVYCGKRYKFWKHREIEGKIKSGSFNQDSLGRWYLNLQCEVPIATPKLIGDEIGIDLGLKDKITISNGVKYSRENITKKYEEKLAKAQRAKKKKLAKRVHIKIKNVRKDWNHKTTTSIIQAAKRLMVGDLDLPKNTRMAKSIYDASFGMVKNLFQYKAIKHGIDFKLISEKYSTVTCSVCFQRTGPSGLKQLGVREWVCESCSTVHDRDTNAAINILRFGTESP